MSGTTISYSNTTNSTSYAYNTFRACTTSSCSTLRNCKVSCELAVPVNPAPPPNVPSVFTPVTTGAPSAPISPLLLGSDKFCMFVIL